MKFCFNLPILVALFVPFRLSLSESPRFREPFVTLVSVEAKNGKISVEFTGDPNVHAVVLSEKWHLSKENREKILNARSFVGQQVKIHVITADQTTKEGIVSILDPGTTLDITLYHPDRPAAWEYFESESGEIMIRGGIPMPPAPGFTIMQPFKFSL